jgi:hypothetical protein
MKPALLLATASCALGLIAATPAWCQRGGMPAPNRGSIPGPITNAIQQATNGTVTLGTTSPDPTPDNPMGSRQHWYDPIIIWEDDKNVSVNGEIPANVANGSVVNNDNVAEATDLNGGSVVAGKPQPTVGVQQPPFYGPMPPVSNTTVDTSLHSMTDEELDELISDDEADSANTFGGVESDALIADEFPAALCGS